MHEKTFYKVIAELYLLSKSDKDIFSDKRLTRTEKKSSKGIFLSEQIKMKKPIRS